MFLDSNEETVKAPWTVVAWICLCTNIASLIISSYHLCLYYQRHKEPFFQGRVGTTTIAIIVYQYLVILHRSIDSILAIESKKTFWFFTDWIGSVQLVPLFGLYSYKLSPFFLLN